MNGSGYDRENCGDFGAWPNLLDGSSVLSVQRDGSDDDKYPKRW